MQKAMSVFQNFYGARTQHRRLQWVHSLGTANVQTFLQRKHILVVNTYQAVILLLFSSSEKLSFKFILESTGLEEPYLKRLLQTLTVSKTKILKKSEDTKTVGEEDEFEANLSFQCPSMKVKIPAPTSEETHNKERIVEDRSIAIEAATVRIMKARKTMSHQHLVAEVLTHLAFFKPNPKTIKQRIEALIEREYLERDPQQASVYRYLA